MDGPDLYGEFAEHLLAVKVRDRVLGHIDNFYARALASRDKRT